MWETILPLIYFKFSCPTPSIWCDHGTNTWYRDSFRDNHLLYFATLGTAVAPSIWDIIDPAGLWIYLNSFVLPFQRFPGYVCTQVNQFNSTSWSILTVHVPLMFILNKRIAPGFTILRVVRHNDLLDRTVHLELTAQLGLRCVVVLEGKRTGCQEYVRDGC